MSGSNPTGATPSGGGGPRFSCGKLHFKTPLNSPNATVIKTLKKDDELDVKLQGPNGPVVVEKKGAVAGSITSSYLIHLIKCMQGGHAYIAIVMGINGGICDVEVRAK